jgi:3alpha(or 20beta)-hydroxysteroid dehydrogenase
MARVFALEGARIVVTDVNETDGRKVAARLGEQGRFARHDVADESSWLAVLAATVSAFGPPDILVNNAGVSLRGPVVDVQMDDLQRVLAVNLVGPILGMKVVGPEMKRRRRGSIVNVSSAAGLVGVYPVVAYAASKWGLRGATKSAAIEFGPHGVRVNSLHPGGVMTPMTGINMDPLAEPPAPGVADRDPSIAVLDAKRTYQPIRRVGRPVEVARLAVFLASDESSYCTGMEFVADGGRTAGFELIAEQER